MTPTVHAAEAPLAQGTQTPPSEPAPAAPSEVRVPETDTVSPESARVPPEPPAVHPAVSPLGPAGWWVLGLGIPFTVTLVTAALMGAWSPSAPPTSSADSTITFFLQVTWVMSILVGAVLVRSWWAVLAVPLVAIVGTFLGEGLAPVIYTAAQYGLAAGFDPSQWPQGDPDGWVLVLMLAVPLTLVPALLGTIGGWLWRRQFGQPNTRR